MSSPSLQPASFCHAGVTATAFLLSLLGRPESGELRTTSSPRDREGMSTRRNLPRPGSQVNITFNSGRLNFQLLFSRTLGRNLLLSSVLVSRSRLRVSFLFNFSTLRSSGTYNFTENNFCFHTCLITYTKSFDRIWMSSPSLQEMKLSQFTSLLIISTSPLYTWRLVDIISKTGGQLHHLSLIKHN